MSQNKLFNITVGIFTVIGSLGSFGELTALEEQKSTETVLQEAVEQKVTQPFTGKTTRSKVRMRLQANLESSVVRELKKGDMLLVLGEDQDFYRVAPPADLKAYVYRTFVLDGVIEGDRVNIRLSPDLDSPIIAQGNTGDKINGDICEIERKWLEIAPPKGVAFFIAKEYIEKIGDENFLVRQQQRHSEAQQLLQQTYLISQAELQKPFEDIQLDRLEANLQRLAKEYSEFTSLVKKSEEMLALVQEAYMQKKIAYLETRAEQVADSWYAKNRNLSEQLESYKANLVQIEQRLKEESGLSISLVEPSNVDSSVKVIPDYDELTILAQQEELPEESDLNNPWEEVENQLFTSWETEHQGNKQDFYNYETAEAEMLSGIIEPYQRNVKNKPGDFLLKDPKSKKTIAYLYSTQVNLKQNAGRLVKIQGTSRPNNHFAFPSYHVLSLSTI